MKSIVSIVLLLFISSTSCASSIGLRDKMYLGFESRISTVHNGNSSWLLLKSMPQTNLGGSVFAGKRFSKNFGIEVGYNHDTGSNKESSLQGAFNVLDNAAGDIAGGLGVAVHPGGAWSINGVHKINLKSRLSGQHVDCVGFMPITENFELFGSLGIAKLKLRIVGTTVVSGAATPIGPGVGAVIPGALPIGNVNNVSSNIRHSINRTVLRLGVGAQYVYRTFGLRATLRFTNTNRRFKFNGNNAMRNHFSLGLGAFIKL